MKKIVLSLMLSLGLLFGYSFALNTSLYTPQFNSSIYKVNIYAYDEVTKSYHLESMWSAVMIYKDKLLTNSHVIFDSKEEVAKYIEVCGIVDQLGSTSCFSDAKVLRYDENIDLAVIEVNNKNYKSPVINQAKSDPKTSDPVFIKWFPSNWYDTVTVTNGTLWWYYDKYIKIDAKIDHGDSWGWVINKKNELVWVPTFVEYGADVLWYMIPISKVKDFIAKKWNVIYSNNTYYPDFANYIYNKKQLATSKLIDNDYFSFDAKDYDITSSNIDNVNKNYRYILTSKNKKASVIITTSKTYFDNTKNDFDNRTKNYINYLNTEYLWNYTWPNYVNVWNYTRGEIYDDKNWEYEAKLKTNEVVNIDIYGEAPKNSTEYTNIKNIIQSIKIKNLWWSTYTNIYNNYWIKINLPNTLTFSNELSDYGQYVWYFGNNTNASGYIEDSHKVTYFASEDDLNDTLKSFDKIINYNDKIIKTTKQLTNSVMSIYTLPSNNKITKDIIIKTSADNKFYINTFEFHYNSWNAEEENYVNTIINSIDA